MKNLRLLALATSLPLLVAIVPAHAVDVPNVSGNCKVTASKRDPQDALERTLANTKARNLLLVHLKKAFADDEVRFIIAADAFVAAKSPSSEDFLSLMASAKDVNLGGSGSGSRTCADQLIANQRARVQNGTLAASSKEAKGLVSMLAGMAAAGATVAFQAWELTEEAKNFLTPNWRKKELALKKQKELEQKKEQKEKEGLSKQQLRTVKGNTSNLVTTGNNLRNTVGLEERSTLDVKSGLIGNSLQLGKNIKKTVMEKKVVVEKKPVVKTLTKTETKSVIKTKSE